MDGDKLKFLQLLSKSFPTIAATTSEIINLKAILNLPKGTEHFLTDIHGEYRAFNHVLRNGSGVIKDKIDDIYGDTLEENLKKQLATVIYYPEEKINLIQKQTADMKGWYKITILRLIEVCRIVSSKYTDSKVRKALPKDFAYIIQELIHEKYSDDKKDYVRNIIDTIIELDIAKEFIVSLSGLIQRLTIDVLHIVGDIYDRGPKPHLIVDKLMQHHNVDIQWGNHDMLWMTAAAGHKCAITNVVRISSRYSNTDILEDVYGINMLPLARFAMSTYANDPCTNFLPKESKDSDVSLMAKIHKAISIIQFKIEGQTILKNPNFNMNSRLLLDKIDYKRGILKVDGKEYPLTDTNFPTINPKDPYALTEEENEILEKLKQSFIHSEKLQKHTKFLFSKGSMFLKYNSNLLFHGCIPVDKNKEFTKMELFGKTFSGKAYLEELDRICREGYFNKTDSKMKEACMDMMWYLWCGENSPLFGKDAMKTFERYFTTDKDLHKENKNYYYSLYEDKDFIDKIFAEFDLDPEKSHIINGHMPVKEKRGESPIKANKKLIVIDGGFSKAYQKETGLAGYTLIYNSYGLKLVSHQPFEDVNTAIANCIDIHSSTRIIKRVLERKKVKDTDVGENIQKQINDLYELLNAYKRGYIKTKEEK
ncbi:fructose-1,6-bisphosphatase [Fusobacterium sp. FSA-380-WT-3A]|uniref:fructose-1,6-bisphosphatase n=1 Tax=Fusobacterium sp. FSA-380-WT-3A TaxID=2725304 RepID=UPI0014769F3C|nr:fructose-1,6-bisphosphatase [Fusobacterium sp. FSA-380-WT-3A]NME34983.1 fructose-1,6-bisphosphatase [Fusobacterium sp. FSA-380-WT-3A]